MFNKIYEWIGTGFGNLRNGAPDADQPDTHGVQPGGPSRKKRSNDWYVLATGFSVVFNLGYQCQFS